MDFKLWYKPGWDAHAAKSITGSLVRTNASTLKLRYLLEGRLSEIVVPDKGPPLRRNNLWETTCFEAFLKPAESETYIELNFSPSTAWAAYHFVGYRSGMVQAGVLLEPEITTTLSREQLQLDVTLSLDLLKVPYAVGISAVVEERSGLKSYWALGHPGEQPDFHHPDCFALELAPPA